MENKRSLKCLIVAACLALLIVSIGGIVSAAGTAVETNSDLKIAGASLDISDKISIAFAVDAAAIGYNADENTAKNFMEETIHVGFLSLLYDIRILRK